MYNTRGDKSLKHSPVLPFSVQRFEGSGHTTIPCVKLSNIGLLVLSNDVAVMTDCQYGETTMYGMMYHGTLV